MNSPLAESAVDLPPASPHARRRTVQDYHERSKHGLQRYAAGPDTLDWDAQPDPFRRWHGAPLTPLPLAADALPASWHEVHAGVPAQPVDRGSVGALFELSFALTAWKRQGPDRWALRATPSSGNLHPTEAYLLAEGVPGLGDGLYHYTPLEHGLELRATPAGPSPNQPRLWIALGSIAWREAWKYGERAFRYGQLDIGHALGALRYAAAVLGWQLRLVRLGSEAIAALCGLDRSADFGTAEREDAECLLEIGPGPLGTAAPPQRWFSPSAWHGMASRLDARPMYRWPVIDQVAAATREPPLAAAVARPPLPAALQASARAGLPAAQLIRTRRSAQHFDRRATMPQACFVRIARSLLPDTPLPWDLWPAARVHAVLYLHRVDGFAPGAYLLPRSAGGAALLAHALPSAALASPSIKGLPLRCIAEHPSLAGTLRTLSCHQAIASDACFTVSLLAEFDTVIDAAPWRHRALFREAGLIGQVLYLQAEAEGFRGTGIGCYFDDAVHELLALAGRRLQVLYQFTVGVPLVDTRLVTEPPYAERPHTPWP